jgi:hypothetical protein
MDKQDKNLLELLGIEIDDNHIAIDFEKAKETIKNIGEKLDTTASKVKENLAQGRVEVPTIGIEMTPERFELDLKQTKEQLDTLVTKISELATANFEGLNINKEDNSTTQSQKESDKTIELQSAGYISFEIVSDCSKSKISKKIGLESQSNRDKVWSISSPKAEIDEFDSAKLAKSLIKLLADAKDEIKDLKDSCNASIKLVVYLNSALEKPNIKISKKSIKFLAEVGGAVEVRFF